MGIATFPAASSGLTSVIRSVQRGVAASAGNITISSVTVAKTIVNSFSTSSAGSVAATGTISAANGTASAFSSSAVSGGIFLGSQSPANIKTGGNFSTSPRYGQSSGPFPGVSFNQNAMNLNAQNIGLNSTNLSGGSTSLTSAVYGAYLVDATTITVTGPCRYEVIEYI